MVIPVIETALGSVNGSNTDFQTSAQYAPGSLRVWLNGMLLRQDLVDGWTETGPVDFRLLETPRLTDIVRVYYLAL